MSTRTLWVLAPSLCLASPALAQTTAAYGYDALNRLSGATVAPR